MPDYLSNSCVRLQTNSVTRIATTESTSATYRNMYFAEISLICCELPSAFRFASCWTCFMLCSLCLFDLLRASIVDLVFAWALWSAVRLNLFEHECRHNGSSQRQTWQSYVAKVSPDRHMQFWRCVRSSSNENIDAWMQSPNIATN